MPTPNAVLLALLTCLVLPPAAGAVHEMLESDIENPLCESCHIGEIAGGALIFSADPVNALCLECHPEVENGADADKNLSFAPTRNAHPVLVPPGTTKIPDDFWLDSEGRVNCATCHDPHPGTIRDNLLRGKLEGISFCLACHDGEDDDAGAHGKGAFVAHARALSDSDGSGAGELDALSYDCTVCHSETSAMKASYCLIGQQGQCTGHIVGIDYAAASTGNAELNTDLDPRISLHEGKIGCTSCHSIYSNLPQHLVFGNSGSALCFACHRK